MVVKIVRKYCTHYSSLIMFSIAIDEQVRLTFYAQMIHLLPTMISLTNIANWGSFRFRSELPNKDAKI